MLVPMVVLVVVLVLVIESEDDDEDEQGGLALMRMVGPAVKPLHYHAGM